jgi:hypothetical protein
MSCSSSSRHFYPLPFLQQRVSKTVPTQQDTCPVSFSFFYCMEGVSLFLDSTSRKRETFLFLTESIQLIFSNLLQHHNSRLHRYISCTFRSVQVSATHKPVLQMQHLPSFILTFQSDLLVITFFFLVTGAFARTILDLI